MCKSDDNLIFYKTTTEKLPTLEVVFVEMSTQGNAIIGLGMMTRYNPEFITLAHNFVNSWI